MGCWGNRTYWAGGGRSALHQRLQQDGGGSPEVWPPRGRGKKAGKDRVCPMAPDVAHVMWPVAGMGAAKAGCAMQLGRISQSLGGG